MRAIPEEIDQKLKEAEYRFLGWQNGWGENPSEYESCLALQHNKGWHKVQHNNRGSENTVSCDVCRIYWKYDCSD